MFSITELTFRVLVGLSKLILAQSRQAMEIFSGQVSHIDVNMGYYEQK